MVVYRVYRRSNLLPDSGWRKIWPRSKSGFVDSNSRASTVTGLALTMDSVPSGRATGGRRRATRTNYPSKPERVPNQTCESPDLPYFIRVRRGTRRNWECVAARYFDVVASVVRYSVGGSCPSLRLGHRADGDSRWYFAGPRPFARPGGAQPDQRRNCLEMVAGKKVAGCSSNGL